MNRMLFFFFFFSSRRRHTRCGRDWSSDVCSSDLEKKVKKLERFSEDIIQAEVILKVVKPEATNNKDAAMKLFLRHGEAYANKKADTFEEAIDLCVTAIEKQIMKTKAKKERPTTKI